jgi:hypothetical protein
LPIAAPSRLGAGYRESKLRNQLPIARIHRISVKPEIRIGFEIHSNGKVSIEKLFKDFESIGHGINGWGLELGAEENEEECIACDSVKQGGD